MPSSWAKFKDKGRVILRRTGKGTIETIDSGTPVSSTTKLRNHQEGEPHSEQIADVRVGDRKAEIAKPQDVDSRNAVTTEGPTEALSKSRPILPNLWQTATDLLDDNDREILGQCQIDQLEALSTTGCPTIVDSIISRAKIIQKQDKEGKWQPGISKFLDGTEKFKAVVDAGLKFDTSGYGAIAWSVISFGLQISINAKRFREYVFSSSEFIAQLLARYTAYEILYRSSGQKSDTYTKFEERLVDVYKAVIIFMLGMEKYLRENSLGHHLKAFVPAEDRTFASQKTAIIEADSSVKEWLPIVKSMSDQDSFRKLENQVAMLQQPIYHLPERLDHIKRFLERDDRKHILSWLPEVQRESIHIDVRNKARIKNPGQWLIKTHEFQIWQNSKSSSGVWLRGAMGTGKTVLTSTVIGYIDSLYQGTSQGAMAYYYCSGSAKNIKAGNILGSILRQLAETDSGLDVLQAWEERGHRPHDLTNETMGDLLQQLVDLNKEFQTTIIIDALDEVDQEEFAAIMDVLETLLSDALGVVKIFLSSRLEDYIDNTIGTWSTIEVEPHLTRNDIERYIDKQVDRKLRDKKKVDNTLSDEVKTFLKENAEGMFRYVEMALRWICEPSNPYDIRTAMEEIPKDLLGIYHILFERIEKDRHQKRELAKRTISWVLGAQSQLSAEELILAISSGYQKYQADITIEDVLSSCHHLVVYNKNSDSFEFGHFSVVEFIRYQKEYCENNIHELIAFLSLNAMLEEARISTRHSKSHQTEKYVLAITATSIPLECSRKSSQKYSAINHRITFWIYATNMWPFHSQKSGADSGEIKMWSEPLSSWSALKAIDKTANFIPSTNNSFISLSRESLDRRIPEILGQTFTEWIFRVSCSFGLYQSVESLLSSDVILLNFRSPMTGAGCLHWAARWGSIETLKLLHQLGVPIDIRDNGNWSPLAYAISGRHENVVKYLLSNGADPKVKSFAGVSVVDLAIEQRFESGLKALLQAGAQHPATRARSQSQPQLPSFRVGDQVPHGIYQHASDLPFLVVNFLGSGGFSNVDLAKDIHNPTIQLVRKVYRLPSPGYAKPNLLEITNEVKMLERLKHHHIVKLISTFETPTTFGFLMWPKGEQNLHKFINRPSYKPKHTPEELRLLEKWMLCLSAATKYMHSQGVCHNVISPSNIICRGEEVYFIDFAYAMQFDPDDEESTRFGVPEFEAPEKLRGTTGGFAADVFSLGAVFSLMGSIISGDSLDEFREARYPEAQGYWDQPRGFYSSFSPVETWLKQRGRPYNELIVRMLSETPEGRPTATEAVEALARINGLPPCDCTPPFGVSSLKSPF